MMGVIVGVIAVAALVVIAGVASLLLTDDEGYTDYTDRRGPQ